MVPRRRSAANRDLPPNLYPCKNGYKYRRPDNRKESWMGMDKAKACAAAKRLNAMLTPSDDLVNKVVAAGQTVADAVRIFRLDDMPHRGWAPKTAAWYEVFLNRIEQDLGKTPVEEISVNTCATYIREVTQSARSRQTYRLMLGWVLTCAIEEGWIESNPALLTRKHAHTRKRERLTLAAFQKIHADAPTWLQNAMDLSLMTLLRREDVAAARFADFHDDALWIIPQKTENSTLMRLKISDSSGDLAALIARCRNDSVLSPYIIHRLPERIASRGKAAKERDHHTQVLPVDITREFASIRDRLDIGGENPPTFHEIRSLGGALLRERGWTDEQVQALMGQADVSTTRGYLEGHDNIPWNEVSTGVTLQK